MLSPSIAEFVTRGRPSVGTVTIMAAKKVDEGRGESVNEAKLRVIQGRRSDEGLEEASILEALQRGDPKVIEEVLCDLVPRVRNWLCRLLGPGADLDDAVQDAFIRVFRAARKFKPTGSAAGWLYRITINACRDRLRKRKRRAISLEQLAREPAAEQQPQQMEVDETVQQVRRAVDQLPPRQRTSVLLHRYQGLTHKQIAEATGWSRSAVENLLVRAYDHLRSTLSHLTRP